MSSWPDLLTRAASGDHIAQLYGDDDQLLTRNVSRYLAEGLRRGDGLVAIATPEHSQAISRHLADETGAVAREGQRQGRLVYFDARGTLDQILEDGEPDRASFDAVVAPALEEARARSGSGRVRAFGEMVSLLWSEGRRAQANLLEARWNATLAAHACSLYCAYRIDFFGDEVDPAGLTALVSAHTHLFAGRGTMLASSRAGWT